MSCILCSYEIDSIDIGKYTIITVIKYLLGFLFARCKSFSLTWLGEMVIGCLHCLETHYAKVIKLVTVLMV